MRVVLAPDKFKGCLTARQVAKAVGKGIRDVRPDVELVALPVADGGDGTVAAAIEAGYAKRRAQAVGPTGEPVMARYALSGKRAVVELAAVVGLDLMPAGLDPMGASTYGLGVVIADAIKRGATDIVIGLGGSASTDGGAGMVQALGARLTDRTGADLAPGGRALAQLGAVDRTELERRVAGVRFLVASDVDNPLLGERGAAAVFGPQKGASPQQVVELDAALAHWSDLVDPALAGTPGAGAAGGTAYAALALLGAELVPGIDLVLDLVDFDRRVRGARLAITGEGSLDEQSLAGKAPVGVARSATAAGVPVVAVAGRSLLSAERLREAGISGAYPLSDLEPDVATSIAQAAPLLRRVGATIAEDWLR